MLAFLLWLLQRIHEWSGRWLRKLAPEAVAAPRPYFSDTHSSPPEHWAALVRERAPQLLDESRHEYSFKVAAQSAPAVRGHSTRAVVETPPTASFKIPIPDLAVSYRRVWRSESANAARRPETRPQPNEEPRSNHASPAALETTPRKIPRAHTEPEQQSSIERTSRDAVDFRFAPRRDEEQPPAPRPPLTPEPPVAEVAGSMWPTLISYNAQPAASPDPSSDEPAALRWPQLPNFRTPAFQPRLSDPDHRARADAEQRGDRWSA